MIVLSLKPFFVVFLHLGILVSNLTDYPRAAMKRKILERIFSKDMQPPSANSKHNCLGIALLLTFWNVRCQIVYANANASENVKILTSRSTKTYETELEVSETMADRC